MKQSCESEKMVVLLNDEESNIEIKKFVWFTYDGSLAKTFLTFTLSRFSQYTSVIMFKIQRFIMCGTLFKSKYESV